MIVINIADFTNGFEVVYFDPDSIRPIYIGMKNGNSDPSLPGWDILKFHYNGPVSAKIIATQRAKGSYSERKTLFPPLPRPAP